MSETRATATVAHWWTTSTLKERIMHTVASKGLGSQWRPTTFATEVSDSVRFDEARERKISLAALVLGLVASALAARLERRTV